MTPEGSKEAAEVMLAYANGEKIEIMLRGSGNWIEMQGNPNWNWSHYQYRKKPQRTSIPATEEELEIIGKGVLWCRHRKNPDRMGWIRHNDALNKSDWLFFNPDTKCWEDWGGK